VLALWILGALSACDNPPPPDDRGAHAAAIAALDEPAAALALCETIDPARSPALAADCRWAVAQALAPEDAAGAGAVCEGLSGAHAEECWFIVAEGSDDAAACGQAGRFERDCRMHRLTAAVLSWPKDMRLDAVAVRGLGAIQAAGLPSDDPDAWMAAYRVVTAQGRPPLDRPACLRALTPGLRGACQAAAEGVLQDRLSQARDRGAALCEGALPAKLAYVPDEVMDRILAERRAADLCDPDAVRPPPPGAQ